ncbi:MAG: serine protease, partial [Planctomycetota bacterium]
LREGDVILSIAGQEVMDGEALRYRPATREAGERIEVRYLRDGRERSTRVRLDLPPMDPDPDTQPIEDEPYLAGVTVANLSPALNEELGRNPFDTGVVVTELDRRVATRRTPVREGYVILSVNGETTPDVRTLKRVLRGGLQSITVRNTRGQTQSFRVRR